MLQQLQLTGALNDGGIVADTDKFVVADTGNTS